MCAARGRAVFAVSRHSCCRDAGKTAARSRSSPAPRRSCPHPVEDLTPPPSRCNDSSTAVVTSPPMHPSTSPVFPGSHQIRHLDAPAATPPRQPGPGAQSTPGAPGSVAPASSAPRGRAGRERCGGVPLECSWTCGQSRQARPGIPPGLGRLAQARLTVQDAPYEVVQLSLDLDGPSQGHRRHQAHS